MATDAEARERKVPHHVVDVARIWADAQASSLHLPEFPEGIGERQQKALEHEQAVVLDRLYIALGFQAEQFKDSGAGWCVRQRLNQALLAAYELGLQDGKDAYYAALGKTQDAFHGAFLTGLLRKAAEVAETTKEGP